MNIETSWNYWLVLLSVLIAVIGSYIAFDAAGRMQFSNGAMRKICFGTGAFMMGLAIWSMHFVGMQALQMPLPVSYNPVLTLLSMVAAMLGAGIAFFVMNRQSMGGFHLVFGSLAMGLAIVTMHYMSRASMQMAAIIQYDPFFFAPSVLIALLVSAGALRLAFRMKVEQGRVWFFQKVGSALVMGAAISGMHYAGMAAAAG